MEFNPDAHAEAKSKGWHSKHWVSLIPYGVDQVHPNAYKDIFRCVVQDVIVSDWAEFGQSTYHCLLRGILPQPLLARQPHGLSAQETRSKCYFL